MSKRRLLRSLLAFALGAGIFAAGWASARYYYLYWQHPPQPEFEVGYCDPGVEQVSIPVPSGPIVLYCTSTLEDVVRTMGQPERHNTLRAAEEQEDFLVFSWETGGTAGVVAIVTFKNGKLWSAFAWEDDIQKYKRALRPKKEAGE